MTSEGVSEIFQTLNASGVRYLVVGGLAVVAHGYVRFTADVDLVLDFAGENLARALASLGYRPRAPVPMEGRGAVSLNSDRFALTEVDLFLTSPFDFEQAAARAVSLEIASNVKAMFTGLDDLIAMKRLSGRPNDLEDIRRLEENRSERSTEA